MGILPGQLHKASIHNLTPKQANVPNFMRVVYRSDAPTCIIGAIEYEPHMLKDESLIQTHFEKFYSNPINYDL